MKRRVLPPINFKAYRQRIYLAVTFAEYGLEFTVGGASYHRGACPLCQGPGVRSRSFAWNFDKCQWYCHQCKKGGDALEMVKLMRKCTVVAAAKWLEERGGPAGSGLVVVPLAPREGVETASS